MQLTLDHDRGVHVKGYESHYARARRAARSPVGPQTYAQAVAPRPAAAMHAAAADRLRALLRGRFSPAELADAAIEPIVDALVRYLREEQAILRSALDIQEAINALLDRPRPERALAVRDLRVNHVMRLGGGDIPYLFDALAEVLGVQVECTANTIDVFDLRAG
jgi:hypothetical protein